MTRQKIYWIKNEYLETGIAVHGAEVCHAMGVIRAGYLLIRNVSKMPIKENLFDRESHCMVNLKK